VEVSAVIRISQIGNGSRWHLLVEGTLSDGWVEALEASWLEAQSQRNGTPVCIDLAGVIHIDDKGRDLLGRIIRSGARLRAQGIMTRAVVEEITKDLKIRMVNVVDLMTLQPASEHPHGLSEEDFDFLFTTDKPIIFAFHGYPWLIHRLTYRRTNHKNLHVRGYKEEGTTTTPFDMTVLNDLDRFHLVEDVIDRVPTLGSKAAHVKQSMRNKLLEHKQYIRKYGDDMPEVRHWKWPY